MGLGKQAKVLSDTQVRAVLAHLGSDGGNAARNQLMVLLSVDAGLRAKEIAGLSWSMVTDAQGTVSDAIRLTNAASKGKSGGIVYMSKRLKAALVEFGDGKVLEGNVIQSRSGKGMSAQVVVNWFFNLYNSLGYSGCSSHSGRRTAITRWARNISAAGGSMRDVQQLARHSSLAMTQRYVEVSKDAMSKVVG